MDIQKRKRRIEIFLDEKEAMFLKKLAEHHNTTEDIEIAVLFRMKLENEKKFFKTHKSIWKSENEFDCLFERKKENE